MAEQGRKFGLSKTGKLGNLANFQAETFDGNTKGKNSNGGKDDGSLASTAVPGAGGGMIDVVKNYKWTLSNVQPQLSEIPYIHLKEYKMTESSIKRQGSFYATVATQGGVDLKKGVTKQASKSAETLAPYRELYPKDNATGFQYKFPFFNDTSFDLSSPNWESTDPIGESIKKMTSGFDKLFGSKLGETVQKGIDAVTAIGEAGLAMEYPSVGITDRPRVFMCHNDRTIRINVTLFNTHSPDDWYKNRDLAYLIMSQNLFNKRDHMTGIPPVFYEVYVPGQYFCYAACMTDIKVKNLGNQRMLDGYIIPDAYEFDLTLSEMTKPSKNQFEAVTSGAAQSSVTTGVR